jgi:aminodeoxyfutalosine synthase
MSSNHHLEVLLNNPQLGTEFKDVTQKVLNEERLTEDEGMFLFEEADMGFVGTLANYVREKKFGDETYFNRNFHIEPTNLCVFDCKFCSYARSFRERNDTDVWVLSEDDMLEIVKAYKGSDVTEVHIVGGVYPKMTLEFYCNFFQKIKEILPGIHVKAFTAVELEYMIRKAKLSIREGLKRLNEYGMDSVPGGGAEIFHPEVRDKICKDKAGTNLWLEIHETAHELGIPSNATMLYGHIEDYYHRIDHMQRLRELQDRTGGFNTFIPLKFRNQNNDMSDVPESSIIDDIKTYAISRLYMDNFDHLKAYWPMIGRTTAQTLLSYGVDDIDGTIDDSTKIYSMAGAEEQRPSMTTHEIISLIKQVGRHPIERDTLYNPINDFKDAKVEAPQTV